MESEFLKFYNSLILQDQQKKFEKQSIENITNSQQGINQIFQIASQDYPNITLEDVKSAGTEVNQAYKKSPALFDQLPKKEEKDSQSNNEDEDEDDESSEAESQQTPVQASTSNGKQIAQSIDISSSQFTAYYNELFGIKTPEIIQEAQQQDVEDGNYMLVVDDNGSFHIVNTEDEDQQTKFTAEDYKKIDNWVSQNKDIWLKYVKQYGGSSVIFTDNLINEVAGRNGITDKEHVKQIINKIKQLTQFKQFSAHLKTVKKQKGQLDKQQKEDLQARYLYAVCLFIDKGIKNAPTPAERAAAKKKKLQEAQAIKAIDISRSKNTKLYNSFIKLFTKYVQQTDLKDSLCQGTGDAYDQQIQWSENDKNDAWQNCQSSNGLPNELVPLLTTSYQSDNLQIKITALYYVIQTVEAKQKAGQYSGDDYQNKSKALNEFRKKVETALAMKTKTKTKIVSAKSSFNFNFQDKNTLAQIISQSN